MSRLKTFTLAIFIFVISYPLMVSATRTFVQADRDSVLNAAKEGNSEYILKFNIGHPDFPLAAVFQIARDYGHSKTVALLAENGADIAQLSKLSITSLANQYLPKIWDSSLQNAVRNALETGDMDGIRWIANKRGMDINQPMWKGNQNALHYMAIHYNSKDWPYQDEVLEVLFALEIDPEKKDHFGNTALDISVDRKNLGFTKKIMDKLGTRHGVVFYSLLSAVAKGDRAGVELMMNAGLGIRHPDFPLVIVFQIARDHGHSKIVGLLAANGVNVTSMFEWPITFLANRYLTKRWDMSLLNAVRNALETGDVEGIRWIVDKRGVDINQPMRTSTQGALHYMATYYNSTEQEQPYKDEVLEALFDLGADLGRKDNLGNTALDIFIERKSLGVTKKIVDRLGMRHEVVQDALLSLVAKGNKAGVEFMADAGLGVGHPDFPLEAVFKSPKTVSIMKSSDSWKKMESKLNTYPRINHLFKSV